MIFIETHTGSNVTADVEIGWLQNRISELYYFSSMKVFRNFMIKQTFQVNNKIK